MSGIELLSLQMARRVREHNEAVDAENNRLSGPNAPKKVPMSPTPVTKPKPQKSFLVLATVYILAVALGLGFLSVSIVPALAPLAIVLAVASVTLAVLSLREL